MFVTVQLAQLSNVLAVTSFCFVSVRNKRSMKKPNNKIYTKLCKCRNENKISADLIPVAYLYYWAARRHSFFLLLFRAKWGEPKEREEPEEFRVRGRCGSEICIDNWRRRTAINNRC